MSRLAFALVASLAVGIVNAIFLPYAEDSDPALYGLLVLNCAVLLACGAVITSESQEEK